MTIALRVRRKTAAATTAALALGGLVAVGAATPAATATATGFDSDCGTTQVELKTLKVSTRKVNVKKRQRVVVVSGTTSGQALREVSVSVDSVRRDTYHVGTQLKPGAHSFKVKVKIPKGAMKGKHALSVDLDGRHRAYESYSARQLKARDLPHSEQVVSVPDLRLPTLKSVTIPTKRVNTTKKAAKVKIVARATDHGGTGIAEVLVNVDNGVGRSSVVLRRQKKKFVGTLTFPRWAGNKRATVGSVFVADRAGNLRTYYRKGEGAGILRKAHRAGFAVTSGRDRQAPVIGEVQASPAAVEVGDSLKRVEYAADVTDTQSGIRHAFARLVPVGGDEDDSVAYAELTRRGGVWTGVGIVECDAAPGSYEVKVNAYDRRLHEASGLFGTVVLAD